MRVLVRVFGLFAISLIGFVLFCTLSEGSFFSRVILFFVVSFFVCPFSQRCQRCLVVEEVVAAAADSVVNAAVMAEAILDLCGSKRRFLCTACFASVTRRKMSKWTIQKVKSRL